MRLQPLYQVARDDVTTHPLVGYEGMPHHRHVPTGETLPSSCIVSYSGTISHQSRTAIGTPDARIASVGRALGGGQGLRTSQWRGAR